MFLSGASQATGIVAQGLTLGIPNPVSGACQEYSAKTNQVIDKNIRQDYDGINWKEYGKEGLIGFGKGFVSSGGLIPYVGTAVEKKMRN